MSVVHFEVDRPRKSAWVRAAQPRKLVDWLADLADRAALTKRNNQRNKL